MTDNNASDVPSASIAAAPSLDRPVGMVANPCGDHGLRPGALRWRSVRIERNTPLLTDGRTRKRTHGQDDFDISHSRPPISSGPISEFPSLRRDGSTPSVTRQLSLVFAKGNLEASL